MRREGLDAAVERVLASPKATRKVLEGLGELIRTRTRPVHGREQTALGILSLIDACEADEAYTKQLEEMQAQLRARAKLN